jgi:glycosyltransferase involved in cell wall biosynthesis
MMEPIQECAEGEAKTIGEISVILVSSAKLTDKSAAAVTLRRHLIGRPGIRVTELPAEFREIYANRWFLKVFARLSRTRLARWMADLELLLHVLLPLHRRLAAPTGQPGRTVVLTLAFSHGWLIAQKYARHYGLPLIVRFDDWWPDMVGVHPWLKPGVERRFHALSDASQVSLCISEGMKQALGGNTPRFVILPIPEQGRRSVALRVPQTPFRMGYLGNLYDYGPMLADLAAAAAGHPGLRIEFRGGEPQWPAALKEGMRRDGLLHGFLEGEAFQDWLESFDVYLVAMFFEPVQRRRVETCFATKLLDYSSLGRPVIVWAPETSAVVQWARRSDAAVCVTDSDPRAVVTAALELAADAQRCQQLGRRIRLAYETEFNPAEMQTEFVKAMVLSLGLPDGSPGESW